MNEVSSKDFMGSGLSFPFRVNAQTGRFAMSRHEENIHESVLLILRTFKGERVMRSDFGATPANVLFSDASAEAIAELEEGICASLEGCEPRVADVSAKASRENRGELSVSISYRVRTTNNLFSRVYPFYLLEGAGI